MSTQNGEYVRRLLDQKQPGFSAALGLALVLAELEEWPPPAPRDRRHQGTEPVTPPARAHEDRQSGFARDFVTADGDRVMVTALTQQQFADLARATGLARTFAFVERLLQADLSTRGDLYTHRVAIAALLAPWFSRHTIADLAAAFTGTSVSWASTTSPIGREPPTLSRRTGVDLADHGAGRSGGRNVVSKSWPAAANCSPGGSGRAAAG
jgi:crotonobetainyl-CoA:carnitine CoA-transferase CaiB-like acyl-CoA transferase